jgi:hypothetical protein
MTRRSVLELSCNLAESRKSFAFVGDFCPSRLHATTFRVAAFSSSSEYPTAVSRAGAMLAVEKENLLAQTNREIVSLRETELRYYVDHIVSHGLDVQCCGL